MYPTIIAAIVASLVTWTVQDWRCAAVEAARLKQEASAAKADDARGGAAASALEGDKAKIEIRYRTITKVVTEIVERPVYRNICLDQDGIDAINGVTK